MLPKRRRCEESKQLQHNLYLAGNTHPSKKRWYDTLETLEGNPSIPLMNAGEIQRSINHIIERDKVKQLRDFTDIKKYIHLKIYFTLNIV